MSIFAATEHSNPRFARLIHDIHQREDPHPMTTPTPPAHGDDKSAASLARALRHNLDVIEKAAVYGQDLIHHLGDPAVANLLEAAVTARRSGVSPLVLDAAAAGIRHTIPPRPVPVPAGTSETGGADRDSEDQGNVVNVFSAPPNGGRS